MRYRLTNPAPIVNVQVRLDTLLASELRGEDLRAAAGSRFIVPRTPGSYNMIVSARDVNGCMSATTVARPVTVQ